MEETRNLVLEIANRLYDLDAEVYRVLGSGLGRVFNASREESIRELTQIMKEHRTSHYLRSSLALIGNMARTIGRAQPVLLPEQLEGPVQRGKPSGDLHRPHLWQRRDRRGFQSGGHPEDQLL